MKKKKNYNFLFYAEVEVVGPYLPKEKIVISEDFEVRQFKASVLPRMDVIEPKLSTEATENERLVTLEYRVQTYNSSIIYLEFNHKVPSSNEAYIKAENLLKHFFTLLSLTVPGNRYYYKITAIGMSPTEEFPIPFESPPSEPLFIGSYDVADDFLLEQLEFTTKIKGLLDTDQTLTKLIEYFNNGLRSEFLQGKENEATVMSFYKVLETVGNIHGKIKTKEEKSKEYDLILETTKNMLNNSSLSHKEKLKNLREINTNIRKVDEGIINAKIENAAKKFRLDKELMSRLKKVMKLRNKVIAHSDTKDISIKLKDKRDLRELAKTFIINYVGQTHGVDIEVLNSVEGIGEHTEWYKSSYANSHLRNKAEKMGII